MVRRRILRRCQASPTTPVQTLGTPSIFGSTIVSHLLENLSFLVTRSKKPVKGKGTDKLRYAELLSPLGEPAAAAEGTLGMKPLPAVSLTNDANVTG